MGVAALSAIRAIRVLEYFERVRGPLSLKKIASHLEIPSSSAASLLKSLAELDYLSYDVETRTYLPTLRLAELGNWVPDRVLDDGVLALAHRLNERTRETIAITSLNDLYLDYIDFKMGRNNAVDYPAQVNIRFPRGVIAATCPFGWCLLGEYKTQQLERVYHRSRIKKLFSLEQFSWNCFADRVESARGSTYLLASGWPYPSSATLVTLLPVFPFGRHVALGVGGSLERMRACLDNLLRIIDEEVARLPVTADQRGRPAPKERQRVAEVEPIGGEITLPESDWDRIR